MSGRGDVTQGRVRSMLIAVLTLVLLAEPVAMLGARSPGAAEAAGPGPRSAQTATQRGKDFSGQVLRLGIQFGLAYLPALAMVRKGFLEKYLPGIKVEEVTLGSGPELTQAVVAGRVDVALIGTPPFLVAWDKGVRWKAVTGLMTIPMILVTNRPGVKSLRDLGRQDKIALPGPNSIQHIVLRMAAQQQLGDPKALDNQILALPHPDAERALYAKQDITFHFSNSPFQQRELNRPGIHAVVNSFEVFGGKHSAGVAAVTERFHAERPEIFAGLAQAFPDAMRFITENPREAASILAGLGDKTPLDELVAIITSADAMPWTVTPHGITKFATFMHQAGLIRTKLNAWRDVVFENLYDTGGD